MPGLAEDVAGLVLEELKRDDGIRRVELRLGNAERYTTPQLVVLAPRVENGLVKLDVFAQYGHDSEERTALGLSIDGALQLAIADAQARGYTAVLAGLYNNDGELFKRPVTHTYVPFERQDGSEATPETCLATLRRLVRAVSE